MRKNYYALKDSELQQLMRDYAISLEGDFTRKSAVLAVKDFEEKLEKGELVVPDMEGNVLEGLKREIPKLRVTTVIFHNTMENDMPYIFVGNNGRGFYIPKETEVDVPDYILNSCIKDAVEDRMFPEQQMNGDIVWKVKKIQRFPYSIINPSREI